MTPQPIDAEFVIIFSRDTVYNCHKVAFISQRSHLLASPLIHCACYIHIRRHQGSIRSTTCILIITVLQIVSKDSRNALLLPAFHYITYSHIDFFSFLTHGQRIDGFSPSPRFSFGQEFVQIKEVILNFILYENLFSWNLKINKNTMILLNVCKKCCLTNFLIDV